MKQRMCAKKCKNQLFNPFHCFAFLFATSVDIQVTAEERERLDQIAPFGVIRVEVTVGCRAKPMRKTRREKE